MSAACPSSSPSCALPPLPLATGEKGRGRAYRRAPSLPFRHAEPPSLPRRACLSAVPSLPSVGVTRSLNLVFN
ncbi:unnamed protein product [Linum trigynum]|uniref:Uncharacterized protein n=1 Tax=Linum trigynum TaxID=586398 RepID=A0AAV2CZM1_9ROSI